MKKSTSKQWFLIVLGMFLFLNACKKDDDPITSPPTDENEVITTLKIVFTDSVDISNVVVAQFRDPDGDGGLSYDIFDTIRLNADKTWYAHIVLLNETTTPIDSITNEVLEEATDHLLCFTPSGTSATVNIHDRDSNNLPIGIDSKWKTSSVGTGTMLIELKHQPGTKTGDCGATGSTDLSVLFRVQII